MSAPKNIQRDGTYAEPGAALISIASSAPATAPNVYSDGTVHYDYGMAHAGYTAQLSVAPFEVGAFGVWIQQPKKDRQPYRVKASIAIQDANGQTSEPVSTLVIGYASGPITGASHILSDPIYIPLHRYYDDLVILEDVLQESDNYGMPVFFGIAVLGEVADAIYFGHVSVQNLGVKPPTMQNAIS